MKKKLHYLVLVLVLAALLPFVGAAETRSFRRLDDAKEPTAKFERRVFPARADAMEKEVVTFLGVETAPVSPTLGAQLNLPKESGLVIVSVAADSPAAAVLKPHDVLLKLADQLLVEPRQLSVLVRQRNDGDEVALTYIRGGKEATAKVKLAKHEVPKMALMGFEGGPAEPYDFLINRRDGMPAMQREEMDRVLGLMSRGPGPGGPGMSTAIAGGAGGAGGANMQFFRHGPGLRSTAVNTTNSNMVFTDEKGSLDLTTKDGKKTLVAKNAKGETTFSGSVDTPEQRKALPDEVRERLERIEVMQDFSFRTDPDFVPGEMKVMRAPARSISMPVPVPNDVFLVPAPAPAVF